MTLKMTTGCGHVFVVAPEHEEGWAREISKLLGLPAGTNGATFECAECGELCVTQVDFVGDGADEKIVWGPLFDIVCGVITDKVEWPVNGAGVGYHPPIVTEQITVTIDDTDPGFYVPLGGEEAAA